MINIKQTVIVEGKYDKIKLESIISANIITTDGFRIYSNSEKQALIRTLAEKNGLIIFTDSDSSGRRIRNFIKSLIGEGGYKDKVINIYLPEIPGKEKRKAAPSKENLIGVEGADKQIIAGIFEKFGIASRAPHAERPARKITKTDFYEDGLSGGSGSAEKRKYLCKKLNLPPMSANALVEAVNILTDFGGYKNIIKELKEHS
jgi:ribonuclease M5